MVPRIARPRDADRTVTACAGDAQEAANARSEEEAAAAADALRAAVEDERAKGVAALEAAAAEHTKARAGL